MKLMFMLKIHIKQNINFLLRDEKVGCLKDFNDSKAFIQYSNDMDDIYKNIEKNNPNTKRKILIVFGYVIVISLVMKNAIQ